MNVEEFAGHTPGPWTTKYDNCDYGSGQWYEISASTKFSYNAKPEESAEAYANARLMAAAPDLLAEVIKLRKLLVGCYLTLKPWNSREPKLIGDMDLTYMLKRLQSQLM